MKRDFNPPTVHKIKTFLERFKKDPTQQVASLCKEISLSKTLLYDYLRVNNLSLDKLRKPEMTKAQNKNPTKLKAQLNERPSPNSPLTHEQMKAIVDEIDEIKKQGYELAEATKRASSGIHFSTYYNYKRKILAKEKKLQNKDKPKRKYTRRNTNNDDMPNFPHTIVYNEKPVKKSQGGIEDLDMMIDHVELLLRYMKKARG